ncbi:hypothetical protein [Thalassotalea mangrovi]|uniref:Uncharacterized protein n=1 Tax=Thalassotalea mangrovi TaxID=2572245 RepID=A0A4U1B4W7_9GAMM|nr:hypothetical protein [Thalassotalea mangrovi]TKB45306.1 hypothetical protein E8M12_08875 [Thalassotalea mangrovi]
MTLIQASVVSQVSAAGYGYGLADMPKMHGCRHGRWYVGNVWNIFPIQFSAEEKAASTPASHQALGPDILS